MKNLRNNSENLSQLMFPGKLFSSGSICYENHQLAYKCRQLENPGKIHSAWFWNNVINVKLNEINQPVFVALKLSSSIIERAMLAEF